VGEPRIFGDRVGSPFRLFTARFFDYPTLTSSSHSTVYSGAAMHKGIEWGLWIAAMGLLVAIAKFIDEYHISSKSKSKTREFLISVFVFIDNPVIVNIPQAIYKRIAWKIGRKHGLWGYFIFWALVYVAVVATFYVVRRTIDPAFDIGFPNYALTWVDNAFWFLFMLFAVISATISYLAVSFLARKWNASSSMLGQTLFTAVTIALTISSIVVTLTGFTVFGLFNQNSGLPIVGGSGVYLGNPYFLTLLTIVCFWHLVFLCSAMIFLTIFRLVYMLAHKLTASVLNAASNPEVSPYQYLATMLALFGLALKVTDELVK
jgi:hypothetical protein